jgi:hypothetical protein
MHTHRQVIDVSYWTPWLLIFAGGFVGTDTEVWVAGTAEDGPMVLKFVGSIYPEDKSKRQIFP